MTTPTLDRKTTSIPPPHALTVLMERLDHHVDWCGESNRQLQRSLDRLESKVEAEFEKAARKREQIHGRIDEIDYRFRNRYHHAVIGVIAVLLSISGYLAANAVL